MISEITAYKRARKSKGVLPGSCAQVGTLSPVNTIRKSYFSSKSLIPKLSATRKKRKKSERRKSQRSIIINIMSMHGHSQNIENQGGLSCLVQSTAFSFSPWCQVMLVLRFFPQTLTWQGKFHTAQQQQPLKVTCYGVGVGGSYWNSQIFCLCAQLWFCIWGGSGKGIICPTSSLLLFDGRGGLHTSLSSS